MYVMSTGSCCKSCTHPLMHSKKQTKCTAAEIAVSSLWSRIRHALSFPSLKLVLTADVMAAGLAAQWPRRRRHCHIWRLCRWRMAADARGAGRAGDERLALAVRRQHGYRQNPKPYLTCGVNHLTAQFLLCPAPSLVEFLQVVKSVHSNIRCCLSMQALPTAGLRACRTSAALAAGAISSSLKLPFNC